MMQTRSAEELWRRLVEEAGEDEIVRAASVSVAQAEKELAEAGFDVAAERARADAFLDDLEGKSRPASETRAQPARLKPRRRLPPVVWFGAAAAAAAVVAAAYSVLRGDLGPAQPPPRSPSAPAPSASPPGPNLVAAADLRRRAAVACDAGYAKECLSLLDRARDIDPAGNSAPDIQKLRQHASDRLEAKPR
jgi:hypothetical protein